MEIHKHLQLIWWSHYFYDDVLIKKNVSAALLMNSGAWEKWNTNKYQTYIKNTTLNYFSEYLNKAVTKQVAQTDSEVPTIQISEKK